MSRAQFVINACWLRPRVLVNLAFERMVIPHGGGVIAFQRVVSSRSITR